MRRLRMRLSLLSLLLLLFLTACTNGVFKGSSTSIVLTPSFALGQPDFDTTTANGGASGLNRPFGVFVLNTQLFVSDASNHRILVWDTLPTTFGQAADRVVGQTSFTGTNANQGGSTNGDTLSSPGGIFATDTLGGFLYVADQNNNRAVIYNFPLATTGEFATSVVGQIGFNGNGSGTAAAQMNAPIGVAAGGGNLYVSEITNNRILVFGSETPSTGTAASLVLGNSTFTSAASGTSSTRFTNLFNIFLYSTRLFLADRSNCRVAIWSPLPNSANDLPAAAVLGQDDFVTGSCAGGNLEANNFNDPKHIATNGTYTFVSDAADHRVLVYEGIPSGTQSAKYVIGQESFSDSGSGSGQYALNGPEGMAATSTQFFLADANNNRVLVYNLP
ncbi:MAG: NHL repeat-containing protein [Bdellovibrionaceae bacterium]|nr:NHL repeat-containing protein [Pseudobdellovibrionaceae bacterium]